MSKLTFFQLAVETARLIDVPKSSEELWAIATSAGLVSRLDTAGATPSKTFGAQLHSSVANNPNSPFVGVGARPRRFWLKERGAPPSIGPEADPESPRATAEPKNEKPKTPARIVERDLHPLVAYVAFHILDGVRVKTVFHEQSTKKAFGEWVHPDLIGVRFPRLQKATSEFATASRATLVETISIELKQRLDFGSLRASFFQAVSNSSWANEGYLAAGQIQADPEFLDELARLSGAFGIGVLALDTASPDDSHVLFPPRRREKLDWPTLDKLAEMNPDVREFLLNSATDLDKGRVREADYDPIPRSGDVLANSLLGFAK